MTPNTSNGRVDNNPLRNYKVNEDSLILDSVGKVPLTYWTMAPNFGDLLSPWLFEKLTNKEVSRVRVKADRKKNVIKNPCYISIGSILSRTQDKSIVWGTGSFGTEQMYHIAKHAKYHAVRGPLTRSLVQNKGIKCPQVYGDPALLVPLVYQPEVEKTHEIGLVLRWSENEWLQLNPPAGVKIIDLGSDDIEGTLDAILSCNKIITSSLHGLIIADAYGIPSAWLSSETPKGGEFKYFDYFLSVNKVRKPAKYDLSKQGISFSKLIEAFSFDDRKIEFDATKLLDACPFLTK